MQADEQKPLLRHVALAAGTSGLALSFVLSPFELIKVMLQPPEHLVCPCMYAAPLESYYSCL